MAQNAVRDVLAMIFTRELLAPSSDLFLVEPWISDIALLDNRSGDFDALNIEWGRREVRLIDVVTQLASGGVQVHIVLRPESHNRRFISRLSDALTDGALSKQCTVTEIDYLHTKGILSDHAVVLGSMNLTEHGVALNDEQISISFDPRAIADARIHFEEYARR